jgi:hypothetical protein
MLSTNAAHQKKKKFSLPKINFKYIPHFRVSVLTALFNAIAIWVHIGTSASAAPLYDNFTKYIQFQSNCFLTAASGGTTAATSSTSITTIVTSFLGLIPWAIILLAGSIIAWQAYQGYQEYQREDLSGMGKSVLSVIVMLLLLVMTSFITDFVVGGTSSTTCPS